MLSHDPQQMLTHHPPQLLKQRHPIITHNYWSGVGFIDWLRINVRSCRPDKVKLCKQEATAGRYNQLLLTIIYNKWVPESNATDAWNRPQTHSTCDQHNNYCNYKITCQKAQSSTIIQVTKFKTKSFFVGKLESFIDQVRNFH